MGPARIYPWRRMHPSRALSIAPGTFFVAQSWAGCITNMPGFNLRQAQAPGLLAASLGLSRMYDDDLEQLRAGMLLYDAFYRWCRDAAKETHNWPTNKVKP